MSLLLIQQRSLKQIVLLNRVLLFLGFAALFLFPFSIYFVAFDKLPVDWQSANQISLGLYSLILFLWMMQNFGFSKSIIHLLLIFSCAFILEVFGVQTGMPFGEYQYTRELGLHVWGAPIIIGLAWYQVVVSSFGLVLFIRKNLNPLVLAFFAAFFILAFDIVLEPFATQVNQYWIWDSGTIPKENYISWLVFGFCLLLFIQSPEEKVVRKNSWIPVLVYFLPWSLFSLTNIVNGIWLPVLISFVFIIVLYFLIIKMRVYQER